MIFLAQFSVMDYKIFFFLATERHVTTEDLEMVFSQEKNIRPAPLKPKRHSGTIVVCIHNGNKLKE